MELFAHSCSAQCLLLSVTETNYLRSELSFILVIMESTDLVNVEETRSRNPFSGRPPPRTLDAFFSEVLDRGIFEKFFSSSSVDDVTQANIAAAAIQDRHTQANNDMKKHNIMIYEDDYTGRESMRKMVYRPPFDTLHIMGAPWLSRHNRGKVPHVGVFSSKQMLLFKSHGWQQSSCLYFTEESVIPISILDGSAWTSSTCCEGRSILERLQMPFPATSDEDQIDTCQPKNEPSSAEWWTTWNKGSKCLRDIVELFEEGDDSMSWSPAKSWISKDKDRNYQ